MALWWKVPAENDRDIWVDLDKLSRISAIPSPEGWLAVFFFIDDPTGRVDLVLSSADYQRLVNQLRGLGASGTGLPPPH